MHFKRLLLGLLMLSAHVNGQTCSPTVCRAFSTAKICLVCNNALGYISDAKGGCFSADSEKCLRVDEGGLCVECASGYLPHGGTCLAVGKIYGITTIDCLEFNADNTCKLCPAGKVPVPNN